MEFYERKDSNNYGLYDEGTFSREWTKSFVWMFVGLVLSGLTSYAMATIFNQYLSTAMIFGCSVGEVVLVMVLSIFVAKMSHAMAILAFLSYSVLNGVTLSTIFLVFDIGSIIRAFVFCALFFGSMALYGFVAKKDLSRLGGLLSAGLVSILVLTVINLFFMSSKFDLILSYVGVAVFLGLTAYDVQKIKNMYDNDLGVVEKNMSIYAALQLYLDFVNILLYVIKIIGVKNLSGGDD